MNRVRFILATCLALVVTTACGDDTTTGIERPTGMDWRGRFSRNDTVSFSYNCGAGTCGGTYAYTSPSMAVEWIGGGTFVATGRTLSEIISGGSVTSSRSYDEVITIQNRPDSTYLETEHGAVPNTSITSTGIVAVHTDPDAVPCTKLFSTIGSTVTGKTCRVVTKWVRLP